MKKEVKTILLAVLLPLLAAGGIYLQMIPKDIPLTRLVPVTAELTLTETGTVTGSRVIQIYPLAPGEVLAIAVREGQRVRAGDVICTIDPEPVLEKIKQTESKIESYRTQLDSGIHTNAGQQALQQILIEQAEKDLAQARTDLERSRALYQEGFLSPADFEAAQQKVSQYQSSLSAGRQELKILAESVLDNENRSYYQALIDIEASNLRLLQKELENSTVTAVADGIITAVPVRETNLAGSAPAAELTVTDQMSIETYVSTNDIGSIAQGDPVRMVLRRRDEDLQFIGTVTQVYDTAESKISALGLEEHKVKVEIMPESPEAWEVLGIGYEVEVQFLLYQQADQLTAPKTALFKANGSDMIWLVRNGRLHAVPVTTGVELRTETVILSGVEPGSYVVTDANDDELKENLRVAIKQ